MLGLVSVYNLLPKDIVEESGTVSEFQSKLQILVMARARQGVDDWQQLLSPRWNIARHPLVAMLA